MLSHKPNFIRVSGSCLLQKWLRFCIDVWDLLIGAGVDWYSFALHRKKTHYIPLTRFMSFLSLNLCYIEQFKSRELLCNRMFLILNKRILGNSKIYTEMHNVPVLYSFILHVVWVSYLIKGSKNRKRWPMFMYQTCSYSIKYKNFVNKGQISYDILWTRYILSVSCIFFIYLYIFNELIHFTFNKIHKNFSRFLICKYMQIYV